MKRDWWSVLLILAAIVLVGYYCRGNDTRRRAAEHSRDSLAVAVVALQDTIAQHRVRDVRDSLAHDSTARADDAKRRRAYSGIAPILDTVTTLDTAGIRRLREGFAAYQAANDSAIAHRDARIVQLAQTVSFYRDTIIPRKDAQMAEAQRQLDAALRRGAPRLACGPSVVAGIGLRGPDATAGYGCSLRL